MQKLNPIGMKTKMSNDIIALVYKLKNHGYTKNGKCFNIFCEHNKRMYFEFYGSKKILNYQQCTIIFT